MTSAELSRYYDLDRSSLSLSRSFGVKELTIELHPPGLAVALRRHSVTKSVARASRYIDSENIAERFIRFVKYAKRFSKVFVNKISSKERDMFDYVSHFPSSFNIIIYKS